MATTQIPRSLANEIRAIRAQHPGASNAQIRVYLQQLGQLARAAQARGITTVAEATQLRALQTAAVAQGVTPQVIAGQLRQIQVDAAAKGITPSVFVEDLQQLHAGFENWLPTHPGGTFAQYGADLRAQQAAQSGATSSTPGWLLPAVLIGGAGVLGIGVVVATSHPHARSSATGHPAHPPMSGPALRSTAA